MRRLGTGCEWKNWPVSGPNGGGGGGENEMGGSGEANRKPVRRPHQVTAVYESMLPRQPLRFLLADDPGSGKTIMAGLLIKELIARGDLQRCLVVCPGSLTEQWQDELYRRSNLR